MGSEVGVVYPKIHVVRDTPSVFIFVVQKCHFSSSLSFLMFSPLEFVAFCCFVDLNIPISFLSFC